MISRGVTVGTWRLGIVEQYIKRRAISLGVGIR